MTADFESLEWDGQGGTPDVQSVVSSAYDGHERELFTFALRTCRDHEAAEDLVHEAFVRLMSELQAGRVPANQRAWLYRVVANLAVSRGRRATVARRWLGAFRAHESAAGPEPMFLDQERRSELETALAALPTDARTALLMAANGFNGHEIAAAIGRTELATRAMMCRARLRLRESLGDREAWT